MIAASVDGGALVKMIYASVIAGVSVAVILSLAILTAIRYADMRRTRRRAAATAYAVMAGVAVSATAAIVVYAVILVARK